MMMRNLGRWIFFRHPFFLSFFLSQRKVRSQQQGLSVGLGLRLGSSSCPGARRSAGTDTHADAAATQVKRICHLQYEATATFLRSCHKWNKPTTPRGLLVGPTGDGRRERQRRHVCKPIPVTKRQTIRVGTTGLDVPGHDEPGREAASQPRATGPDGGGRWKQSNNCGVGRRRHAWTPGTWAAPRLGFDNASVGRRGRRADRGREAPVPRGRDGRNS